MNLFSFYSILSVLGRGNYQLSIIHYRTLALIVSIQQSASLLSWEGTTLTAILLLKKRREKQLGDFQE